MNLITAETNMFFISLQIAQTILSKAENQYVEGGEKRFPIIFLHRNIPVRIMVYENTLNTP